jgi:4-hydroxy-3-polyprenylbenzoate decarboxylase
MSDPTTRVIVAMTGASATPYAFRLLEVLAQARIGVELMASPTVDELCRVELGRGLADELARLYGGELAEGTAIGRAADGGPLVRRHGLRDFSAAAASGSGHRTPMVVVPCSTGTLGRIAHGVSESLITRAADVCLKERRPLVLVPRETPLSAVHLESMLALTRAGAVILPASPGFYHRPAGIGDLLDFIVQRILSHLGVDLRIQAGWGEGK